MTEAKPKKRVPNYRALFGARMAIDNPGLWALDGSSSSSVQSIANKGISEARNTFCRGNLLYKKRKVPNDQIEG